MIGARSQIAKLESDVGSLETAKKRAKLDYDSDLAKIKLERQWDKDSANELKNKLKFLSHKEKELQEEIVELRHETKLMKSQNDQKVIQLLKDKQELESLLINEQEKSEETVHCLRNDIMRLELEMKILKSDLDEKEQKVKFLKRRNEELKTQLEEYADFRLTSQNSEAKARELEIELNKFKDDSVRFKAMAEKLQLYPVLERENRLLKEDNTVLIANQDNSILLCEERDSVQKKLERANARISEMSRLEVEKDELQKRLSMWETPECLEGVHFSDPYDMVKQLEKLQTENVLLLSKLGTVQATSNSSERSLQVKQNNLQVYEQQITQTELKCKQLLDRKQKMMKKLVLVTKERDGYKSMLNSYESEVTVDMSSQYKTRIEQLETIVSQYHDMVAKLEEELGANKLEKSQSVEVKSSTSTEAHEKEISELQKRIMELEDLLEQRNIQGDYDPRKTKVLHFTMNPVEVAQKERAEEITKLKEENEKLKKSLIALDTSRINLDEISGIKTSVESDEVKGMKAKLTSADLKNQRLMEAFKQKSQEYREVCYQLTGFRIDIPTDNHYRLMSMFAEKPSDYLMFQQTARGELQLLETEFSSSSVIKEMIQNMLLTKNSIPAFLASLTMQLFSQQTMM